VCSRAARKKNTPTGELKKVGVVVTPYEAQDQVYLDIKAGRLDGTVADVLEVTGGFLSKPEGKDYVLVGPNCSFPSTSVPVPASRSARARPAEEGTQRCHQGHPRQRHYKKINDKYFKIDVYGK
jgi:arginine/ornithine transport system substrate-binding protein